VLPRLGKEKIGENAGGVLEKVSRGVLIVLLRGNENGRAKTYVLRTSQLDQGGLRGAGYKGGITR